VQSTRPIRVAIIGTGNIGTDLCYRMLRDKRFEVVALVGRRADSPGLEMFKGQVKNLISNGIDGLLPFIDNFDGAFDATSAFDHLNHWRVLEAAKKWVMDLTPSKIGLPMVPVLIGKIPEMTLQGSNSSNYSMVTCGGQSSAPILFAMANASTGITEVEVSSSIAALSAGPATRLNLDQYIESTEGLISLISGCTKVKAILVLNPAEPPVMMRTTINISAENFDLELARDNARRIVLDVQKYVPGYELVVEPHLQSPATISATVKVTGAGYVLPEYAGNLDIINSAAVEIASLHSEASRNLALR
jgi:acetaldehyde dehydrogenase (acetylating)